MSEIMHVAYLKDKVNELIAAGEIKDDYIEKLKEHIAELRHELGVEIVKIGYSSTKYKSELPAPVNGVITLESGMSYSPTVNIGRNQIDFPMIKVDE